MRKSEIKVGKKYSDKHGNVRLVLAIGPEYVLYNGQADCECLRYKLVEKKCGPYLLGTEANCTLRSFAHWAKFLHKDNNKK